MSAAASSSSSASSLAARIAAHTAMLERLGAINDLEDFAKAVVAEKGIVVDRGYVPDYYVLPNVKKSSKDKSKLNKMLLTSRYVEETKTVPGYLSLRVEIQDIGDGFARIGAIGDGNCMVHSLFTAASETYRKLGVLERQTVADVFRDVLTTRVDELKAIADIVYLEQGGSGAWEETFAQLEGPEPAPSNSNSSSSKSSSSGTLANRSEIDVSLGPIIARMFGFNFLAVRIDERLRMTPVGQTLVGRDPDLPTIFIHYMGGGRLDFGARGAAAKDSRVGHYEVIVRPRLTADYSPSADSILPESGMVELDEDNTIFRMSSADLRGVMDLFDDMQARAMTEKTKRAFLASIARKQREGVPISPASAASYAALQRIEAQAAAAAAAAPAGAGSSKRATTAKKGATAAKRATTAKKGATAAKAAENNGAVSPSTLAAIEAMSGFHVAGENGGVSPRTLAAIAALEAGSPPKKASSAKRATTVRKKKSPVAAGGAGAPAPARRSERIRKTTQRKKSSSSSSNNSVSPRTRAAILALKKKSSSGNSISSETRAAIAALEGMTLKGNGSNNSA